MSGHHWLSAATASAGTVGLLFDLAGAVMIYLSGKLPGWAPRYALIAPDDWDPAQQEEKDKAERRRLDRIGRAGLVLLIIGFALQLLGSVAGAWLRERID